MARRTQTPGGRGRRPGQGRADLGRPERRAELDTLSQVISANLTRAALEVAPVIADLASWLADVAGKAGIAWERLFDAPEESAERIAAIVACHTDVSVNSRGSTASTRAMPGA
jgi:hypothetical protein